MVTTSHDKPHDDERRKADRRKADTPYAGPDRRVASRRSGQDRRASPRD